MSLAFDARILELCFLLLVGVTLGVLALLWRQDGDVAVVPLPNRPRIVWQVSPGPFLGILPDPECAHVPGGVLHVHEVQPGQVIGQLGARPIHDTIALRVSGGAPPAGQVVLRGAPTTWLRFRFAGMGSPTPDPASGTLRLLDRDDYRIVYPLDTPLALDTRQPSSWQS